MSTAKSVTQSDGLVWHRGESTAPLLIRLIWRLHAEPMQDLSTPIPGFCRIVEGRGDVES